MTSNIFFL